jgi:hypothetical protein
MKKIIPATFLLTIVTPLLARQNPSRTTGSIVVNSETTILVASKEPEAVRHTADDLAADFKAVTGKQPRIVNRQEDAAAVTILIGQQNNLPEAMRTSGVTAPESFVISTKHANWSRPTQVIVLSGPDMRGTMFAVYEFSENYLGVDPMYYWTDHIPAQRSSIQIPATLDEKFPAPVFRYRGFFINDEDMLTGWAPGEKKDHTGISLDVWNKIYETILRLKGNMVAPGTWIFPNDPQVKLAATRGLIVTQHHAIPLGLNVARWPQDVPYNYSTHPEILERAWKNAVNSYLPGQEVLWSVGLRGLSDVTYASMDPSVRNDNKALGKLISKAIADQVGIVKAVHPHAEFFTNLWQEGARLAQRGDLKIPPEVSTVWADAGYGYIEDGGEVTSGQGIYDHVAMMNGRANQLTERVPVERSLSEIKRYIDAKATAYFLVNTSDIRPVPMSIKAVMDAVWRGVPEGSEAAGKFYRDWATEEFGAKAAPKLAKLYKDYFKAPAHFGDPPKEYGDQLYHTEARRMMLTYMTDAPLYAIPSQAPKWSHPRVLLPGVESYRPVGKEWLAKTVEKELKQCGDAQARWDGVWNQAIAIQPLIPAPRRSFFDEQVIAMIQINRESNRMLQLVSGAIQNAQQGNIAEAHEQLQKALDSLVQIRKAETAAEYGKWKNWYRGDWLTGIYRTGQIIEIMNKFLDDPQTHLAPPVLWDGWEAYYHIMHYEGDRSADVR